MNFTFLTRTTLNHIQSASGIELVGNSIYIIGDDSPFLFRLNNKLEVEEKIQIILGLAAVNGKISKPEKYDLESMALWEHDKNKILLLFGSGSKSPQRDVLLCVDIAHEHSIKKYSLQTFYDTLCTLAKIDRAELNLEAAVIQGDHLYLFDRGSNTIFQTKLSELLSNLEANTHNPDIKIFSATLPSLNEIEAGFSGATLSPDGQQIIFTASVENTPNPIDDGEILGSFVGVFQLSELNSSFSPNCIAIKDEAENILKIKVESVAVQKIISANIFRLLLVTDNDDTSSELIEANLKSN